MPEEADGALTGSGGCDGLRAMEDAEKEFSGLVSAVLARFFAQNDRAPLPAAESAAFGARLWSLVGERGLPRPLGPDEIGAPGGMAKTKARHSWRGRWAESTIRYSRTRRSSS